MSMVFNLRRHQPPRACARRALIELSATGVFKEIEFQLAEPLLIKAASRMSNLLTSFTVLPGSCFTHSSCYLQLRVSQDRYLLRDSATKDPAGGPLVTSRRLIRAARRRCRITWVRKTFPRFLLYSRGRGSVFRQCLLIRDPSSGILAQFSLFLSLAFSLLLNHLHRRRRFITARRMSLSHNAGP